MFKNLITLHSAFYGNAEYFVGTNISLSSTEESTDLDVKARTNDVVSLGRFKHL